MLELTPEHREALHAATLKHYQTIRPDSHRDWEQLEGAIFISRNHYLYQYKVSRSPLRFGYKYLSPQTLAQAFNLETTDSGWIHGNIIRTGRTSEGDWAALWVPRQRHSIMIAGAGKDGTDLTLTVPLPAMVFAGRHQAYWLWAVPDTQFNPNSQTMKVPLPNVYSHSGTICWGANVPPVATAQTLPQAWKIFITSRFSGHELHGKSGRCPSNLIQQLKAIANRRTYPVKDLQPLRACANTIDHVLNQALDL